MCRAWLVNDVGMLALSDESLVCKDLLCVQFISFFLSVASTNTDSAVVPSSSVHQSDFFASTLGRIWELRSHSKMHPERCCVVGRVDKTLGSDFGWWLAGVCPSPCRILQSFFCGCGPKWCNESCGFLSGIFVIKLWDFSFIFKTLPHTCALGVSGGDDRGVMIININH